MRRQVEAVEERTLQWHETCRVREAQGDMIMRVALPLGIGGVVLAEDDELAHVNLLGHEAWMPPQPSGIMHGGLTRVEHRVTDCLAAEGARRRQGCGACTAAMRRMGERHKVDLTRGTGLLTPTDGVQQGCLLVRLRGQADTFGWALCGERHPRRCSGVR